MIRYHYEKDKIHFDKLCREVEEYLDSNDEVDLWSYVYTVRTGIGAWVPMEGGEKDERD